MSNELVVVDSAPVTPEALKMQVNSIQRAMKEVMEDGVHFGKVPGCGDKPALLKPGAEKIGLMFRLVPEFQITRNDLPDGHREYEIICTLKSSGGQLIGQGVGNCSTMETKYRYRGTELEITETPVPKGYWDNRDAAILAQAMGGEFEPKQLSAKKNEKNQWVVAIKGDKKENPDIADTYNTVLKMAKKRAHVDAILTCTAASDIFTQDIDENLEPMNVTPPKAAPAKAPTMLKNKKAHWYFLPNASLEQVAFMESNGCIEYSFEEQSAIDGNLDTVRGLWKSPILFENEKMKKFYVENIPQGIKEVEIGE